MGAGRERKYTRTLGLGVLGAVLGATLVWGLSHPRAAPKAPPSLSPPAERVSSGSAPDLPRLRGEAHTQLEDFGAIDADGFEVLTVRALDLVLDLSGVKQHLVRVSGGSAQGVEAILRRGPSGKVSLAEIFGRGKRQPQDNDAAREAASSIPSLLDIGPLAVRDARLRVALIENPLVISVRQAKVRIQRGTQDSAPRLFLSEVYGYMEDPDPLPQPIRIQGGDGVIDLAGHDSVVELRLRVCLGGSELRAQIHVPEHKGKVSVRAESSGLLAAAALRALALFSRLKSEKLDVSEGSVAIADRGTCSRADGRAARRGL